MAPTTELGLVTSSDSLLLKDGCEGWLSSQRLQVARAMDDGHPLWCCPSIIVPVSHPMVILAVPISEILIGGCAITNVVSHLGTEAGVSYIKKHGVIARIPINGCFFAPMGWATLLMAPMLLPKSGLPKTGKPEDEELAYSIIMPILDTKFKKDITPACMKVVADYNLEYLKKNII